ncbi:MAG: SDR family oxidoreductase [Patescibacteria group bacterium]
MLDSQGHLVTGATGFIGRHLVRELLARNERVWILVRSTTTQTAHDRARAVFSTALDSGFLIVLEGDIVKPDMGLDGKSLAELSKEKITLWHLAADLSFSPKKSAVAERTNREGTAQVVTFANRYATRLIHMSTAYVCGDTTRLFTESDFDVGQRFRNHYERSKFAAEKIVQDQCVVPHLIFRPSIVIGDAYEGKAEGCTFGYYRFAFMLHVFQVWLLTTLNRGSVGALVLRTLGTRTSSKDDVVRAPWLLVPYPTDGFVDMVPIDYVVQSLIQTMLRAEAWRLKTFHLTQRTPLESRVVMDQTMQDMGITGVHYLQVPSWVFFSLVQILYTILWPLRPYTKSVLWYLPYVARPYHFDHAHMDALGLPAPSQLSRGFLQRINRHAKDTVFSTISLDKLF